MNSVTIYFIVHIKNFNYPLTSLTYLDVENFLPDPLLWFVLSILVRCTGFSWLTESSWFLCSWTPSKIFWREKNVTNFTNGIAKYCILCSLMKIHRPIKCFLPVGGNGHRFRVYLCRLFGWYLHYLMPFSDCLAKVNFQQFSLIYCYSAVMVLERYK